MWGGYLGLISHALSPRRSRLFTPGTKPVVAGEEEDCLRWVSEETCCTPSSHSRAQQKWNNPPKFYTLCSEEKSKPWLLLISAAILWAPCFPSPINVAPAGSAPKCLTLVCTEISHFKQVAEHPHPKVGIPHPSHLYSWELALDSFLIWPAKSMQQFVQHCLTRRAYIYVQIKICLFLHFLSSILNNFLSHNH